MIWTISLPFLLVISLLSALLLSQQIAHTKALERMMRALYSEKQLPWPETNTVAEPPKPPAKPPARRISIPIPVGPWSKPANKV